MTKLFPRALLICGAAMVAKKSELADGLQLDSKQQEDKGVEHLPSFDQPNVLCRYSFGDTSFLIDKRPVWVALPDLR